MHVHTFTAQNPILFEIRVTKNRGAGGENVRGQNFENVARIQNRVWCIKLRTL